MSKLMETPKERFFRMIHEDNLDLNEESIEYLLEAIEDGTPEGFVRMMNKAPLKVAQNVLDVFSFLFVEGDRE